MVPAVNQKFCSFSLNQGDWLDFMWQANFSSGPSYSSSPPKSAYALKCHWFIVLYNVLSIVIYSYFNIHASLSSLHTDVQILGLEVWHIFQPFLQHIYIHTSPNSCQRSVCTWLNGYKVVSSPSVSRFIVCELYIGTYCQRSRRVFGFPFVWIYDYCVYRRGVFIWCDWEFSFHVGSPADVLLFSFTLFGI